MTYILKHFDTPLLKFSLTQEGLKGVICRILWENESKKELLPIGLEVTDEGVLSWLRSRAIPKNRGYIEAILASMKLSENDLIGILNTCLGLSLNDCYWVVGEDFTGEFKNYNLYDNDFSKPLSLVAYVGFGSVKAKGFTSSPEFTTNGMLRKGWRKIQGKTLLYKGGSEGAANTGNEPYCEFYASQIAETMGLKHIEYTLSSWKKSVCSVCEIFTSKDKMYVPIWRFGIFKNIVEVTDYLKSLGDDYYNDFADMMIFDALIYNTDRHQGNFGLIVDAKTNTPISLAPIFDNGLGLFPYAMSDDIKNLDDYAKTRDSAFGISFDEVAKEFITERHKKMLRKMLTFSFEKDKNYNLPAKRLNAIEKFIRHRASELLNM